MKKIINAIKSLFEVYCREFKLVIHDQGIILFFLFLPLAYPIIYSLIYNPELVKDVPFVVVDNDRTSESRRLVRMLDACDQASLAGYASDLPEARRAMNEQKAFAILEIPEGFERKIGENQTANTVLYCDMALLLRYRGFLMASTNVMTEMGAEIMTEKIDEIAPLADTIVDGDLLPINNISLGNIRNGFDSFIMPGVLILILCQCIVLASGMAGGAKRENPKLVGYQGVNNAPSVMMTMIGEALCYLTIIALPMIFLIHYVPLIFRFPMAGNLFEEILFMVPVVIGCCGLGFAVQGMVNEREEIFVIWVFTSLILLFVSGLIWPRYDMPVFWRGVGCIFPSTWGVEGFIKMNANGSRLWQVAPEYINLWITAGGWWILGWVIRRWVVRPREWKAIQG